MNAKEVIEKLKLQPHQGEGGYFLETYRSNKKIMVDYDKNDNERNYSTAIYYLLTPDNFSSLHRIKQDEIFHFYGGDPVELVVFKNKDKANIITIGNNFIEDEKPQVLVPSCCWQGLRLKEGYKHGWCLMGTTVSPGFDFRDFEIGDRDQLLSKFPNHKEIILKYTRQ